VTGDGLAVRQGPGTAYTLLAAARWDDDGVEVLGSPYRLSVGDELVIGQGPLAIDGRDWYGVMNSDRAINWTLPGDPEFGVPGWVAANDGAAAFVRLVTQASDSCCFSNSGIGPATTGEVPAPPTPQGGSRGVEITVGHADPAESCHVRVADETGHVLVEETIVGWGNASGWWPGEGSRLLIETECSWSLRVGYWVG
jgi:hypothetical protein